MLHIEEGSLEAIHKNKIEDLYEYISGFTEEERIRKLDMAPDRADVILPATEMFLEILATEFSVRSISSLPNP